MQVRGRSRDRELGEILDPAETSQAEIRRALESLFNAERQIGSHLDRHRGTVHIEDLDLPANVFGALVEIFNTLEAGHAVSVHRVEEEDLTTSQAAEMLRMSRPTLINLLAKGEMRYRMVGSHRRIPLSEILAYRSKMLRGESAAGRRPSREERLRGLQEMAEYTDSLGKGY